MSGDFHVILQKPAYLMIVSESVIIILVSIFNRYVSYIGRLVAKEQPHSHAVRITALKMTTVPRMDRSK